MKRRLGTLGVVAGALLQACSGADQPTEPRAPLESAMARMAVTANERASLRAHAQVVSAACHITGALDDYRALLGTLNPNTVGAFASGRREINWDAVPAANTNTNDFPADFFNQPVTGRARGTVFSTEGTGFRVSDNDFADVNPDYADEFNFFSPIRTFAAVGSNRLSVDFFVAGTTTPAVSTGFGVIFSDVDRPGSAAIRLRDAHGRSLGSYQAPPCPGGFSFIGVAYPSSVVASVDIRSGRGALGADIDDVSDRNHGRARDLVIMDDFIYGEPQPQH
jgi:hypothetical protein